MFDRATGHVYRERTVSRSLLLGHGAGADWSRPRPSARPKPRGSRGPRTLIDMAIGVFVVNIGDVRDGHLDALPAHLLRRIWRLVEDGGVCLHAWRLFSQKLLRGDDAKTMGLYRFCHHICRPADELDTYTRPLTSLSIDFVTHLCINGPCEFGTNELLCLADVKNLGVLEIIQPFHQDSPELGLVNDRLLRGWSDMDEPFPLLRILRIWGEQTTTPESLRWVSTFPALAMYDVAGLKKDWTTPMSHATDGGWTVRVTSPSMHVPLVPDMMLFASRQDAASSAATGSASSPAMDSDSSSGTDSDSSSVSVSALTIGRRLAALYLDPSCALEFIANREAPYLLDRLTMTDVPVQDLAAMPRLDRRPCRDTAFEPWAFWLYSLIGQLTNDGDMVSRGVQASVQAVIGPLVLPSKPFVSLSLGHSEREGVIMRPTYWERGHILSKRYTYTRSARERPQTKAEPMARQPPKDEAGRVDRQPPLRRRKRQRMNDVLHSFST